MDDCQEHGKLQPHGVLSTTDVGLVWWLEKIRSHRQLAITLVYADSTTVHLGCPLMVEQFHRLPDLMGWFTSLGVISGPVLRIWEERVIDILSPLLPAQNLLWITWLSISFMLISFTYIHIWCGDLHPRQVVLRPSKRVCTPASALCYGSFIPWWIFTKLVIYPTSPLCL